MGEKIRYPTASGATHTEADADRFWLKMRFKTCPILPLLLGHLLILSSQSFAQSLTISAPTAGQSVNGFVTFAATGTDVASVEFDIGSLRLGTATTAPFSVTWNSGYAGDGNYEVEAVGRDSSGNQVASASQLFVINNHGNTLNVTSPDLSQPVSGITTLNLSGSDSQYWPAIWSFYVDGELVATVWTDHARVASDSITTSVGTSRYPNGPHELSIEVNDNWSDGNWHPYRAGYDRVIDIENGKTLMDVAANYMHVYLQPNGATRLACRDLYTDGSSAACSSPTYATVSCNNTGSNSCSPARSSVLRVDGSGNVTAGNGEGFATVEVSDSGKSTYVYVWVRTSTGVPHFSGNGQFLNAYTSGRSLFVVAPFDTNVSEFQNSSAETASLQSAGVNTLSQGIYSNPRNTTQDLASWKSYYDSNYTNAFNWAANNGFHLLLTGDDVTRDPCGDAWWSYTWPSAEAAIQYAFQQTAATGVAIGVEMVDEVSSIWGPTPFPKRDWLESCGAIPRTWFRTLHSWITPANGDLRDKEPKSGQCAPHCPTLPIAYPPLGIGSAPQWGAWDGVGGASDYGSNFWDSLVNNHTYVWSTGMQERSYWMSQFFYQHQTYAMLDRPQLMLQSASGPYYTKETVGGTYFTPPTDVLLQPGQIGPSLTGGVMTAAALGNAGVRLYYWDSPGNASSRASDPLGTAEQTGVNSVSTDPLISENWQAVSSAATALATLTPYLLANTLNAPAYGRNLITAARQAANGRLLMIVNGWDYPRTIPVDLTPYTYVGAITRYIVSAYGNTTTTVTSGSTTDSVTLNGGDTAAYVFTPGSDPAPVPSASIRSSY